MDKQTIRKQMIARLNELSLEEHAQLSRKIKRNIIQSEEFNKAKIIGITVSRYPEVDTRLIIEAAWLMGKQVVVPRCKQETREMDFRLLTSFDDLESVYMNLLEPIITRTVSISKEQIDLQIVPGVVFSNEGYRIGFGGGYYDRYMVDYKGETISLCFECQAGYDVPVEQHDIPVVKMITESRSINCKEIRDSK